MIKFNFKFFIIVILFVLSSLISFIKSDINYKMGLPFTWITVYDGAFMPKIDLGILFLDVLILYFLVFIIFKAIDICKKKGGQLTEKIKIRWKFSSMLP